MSHAADLLKGTEEGNQAGLHTCAATINKKEHAPLIDLPVSIGRCVKAATGSLQEFAHSLGIVGASGTEAARQTPQTLRRQR